MHEGEVEGLNPGQRKVSKKAHKKCHGYAMGVWLTSGASRIFLLFFVKFFMIFRN
jgi:hypothetical protein